MILHTSSQPKSSLIITIVTARRTSFQKGQSMLIVSSPLHCAHPPRKRLSPLSSLPCALLCTRIGVPSAHPTSSPAGDTTGTQCTTSERMLRGNLRGAQVVPPDGTRALTDDEYDERVYLSRENGCGHGTRGVVVARHPEKVRERSGVNG